MNFARVQLKSLSRQFLAVCFANAPFWIISIVMFINRPLFSYDTIVALVIAVFHKPIGGFLLVVAWLADGLVSQSLTYQFLAPIDFLQSARFGGDINWRQFLAYWHVIGFFIFLISLYLLFTIYKSCSDPVNCVVNLLIIGFFLVMLDAANGASDLWRRDKMIVPINLAGSPGLTLAKSSLKPPEKRGLHRVAYDHSISKKFDIVAWATAHPDRSILFVVVESLGVPSSNYALEFLLQSVYDNNYNTEYYEIEFQGATTSGELRSLCGLKGSYTSINKSTGNDCLPAQLSRLGWHTTGFHGFSSRVFDRQSWWPAIGLDKTLFMENKEVANLNRCGNVFRGACDKDLVDLTVSQMAAPKSFAYLLTLNTHLPVVPLELPNTLSEICRIEGLPGGACTHIAALQNVLGGIISSVSVLPIRPLIIIVGDHAPPFSVISDRRAFRQDVVPGFVLVPKM